jgi:hypothetical protein
MECKWYSREERREKMREKGREKIGGYGESLEVGKA